MSEIKVNKVSPRTNCGTVTLGDSGDTFTIPAGVSISNSGTASGFGSTGEVSWVTTKKTTTFTATAGEGYFCDTSSGGFTVNLPAGTAGASFAVADYTNTFQTGSLVISPNGTNKIGGVNSNVTLSTEGQSAYFVYVDDTEGWKNVIDSTSNIVGSSFIAATGGTITTVNCGACKVHTFTGPGTFCVSGLATAPANNQVSYIVVGGGGGANQNYAGGGGAGGFREDKSPVTPYTASPLDGAGNISVTATGFPITVGAGGGAPPTPNGRGDSGNPSTFSTITSTGGGGGGAGHTPEPSSNGPGLPGGSGGGAGGYGPSGQSGGSGNSPSVSPPQGNNGGSTSSPSGSAYTSAGGGGATAVGGSPPSQTSAGGCGGAGATTHITGSPVAYAGGGGGGVYSPPSPTAVNAGGTGGGGQGTPNGANPYPAASQNGTANTGGGAGGGGNSAGGYSGGSGVVIIRYKIA